MVFRELWALNEEGLEIGLHHGSLAPERRRKVEAAMAQGPCARWSVPRPWISALIGGQLIKLSMLVRRKGRAALRNGLAGPITGLTKAQPRS